MNINHTYQVFSAEDHSNAKINAARVSFKHEGEAGYVISENGKMARIQFESDLPYPADTLGKSAQNHITEIIAEQEALQKIKEGM